MSIWRGKHGPLLIAEIGGNHEGNFDYALKLTQLAIEANVDYIKYQIYTGDTLVSRLESPVRNEHFKKFELSKEQYIQLAQLCQSNGVKFLASVWNMDSLAWIDDYLDMYKIGSGDLTAYPVLKRIAQQNKPILLSTGLSHQQEVLDTVAYIQQCNPMYKHSHNLALLQCTAMYPIRYEDAHLNVLAELKKLTGLPVGYSDHTEGAYALEVAIAAGADILEFHFTDTRENQNFRDHKVSLTKSEVLSLIEKITCINQLKGDDTKKPLEIEGDHTITFRRAVYPAIDLKKGTLIENKHLICLRPNHGIDARKYDSIIGKTLNTDLKAHQKLSLDMFVE